MFDPWAKRLIVLTAFVASGCAIDGVNNPRASAEVKAVAFLKREVPAWSRDNGCFSCHNNGDAARALYAAAQKRYHIPTKVLADTTAWVVQPDRWEHNKDDPGFSDQRLANIQFAASLLAAFEAGQVKDHRPLRVAVLKVAADQAADGAWHIEPQNSVGSPATYGTALATCMALSTLKRAGAPGTSEAIRKAEGWLRNARPDDIPSVVAILRSSVNDSTEFARHNREESMNLIRHAQTPTGGWGPYADSPPEPFDTALVLLALAEVRDTAGVKELIRRGRAFLTSQQHPDGSWPATTRPPGGNSYAQRISTTGWATLALMATTE